MQFKPTTHEVLKNFATINSNFYYSGEGKMTTVSPMKNILVEFDTKDDLPEFGIYDLSEFLSVLSLYRDPDLKFSEDYVGISWGDRKSTVVRFHFASKNILTVSDRSIDVEDFAVSLDITKDLITDTLKSAAVLQLNDIRLKSDGITTTFGVIDKANGNKNSHLTVIENTEQGPAYEYYFKPENLKMIPGDYNLSISADGIARFQSKLGPDSENITYWIATEK